MFYDQLFQGNLSLMFRFFQRLKSLKKMNLCYSKKLNEIPDLSYAINLKEMDLSGCESLVTLP